MVAQLSLLSSSDDKPAIQPEFLYLQHNGISTLQLSNGQNKDSTTVNKGLFPLAYCHSLSQSADNATVTVDISQEKDHRQEKQKQAQQMNDDPWSTLEPAASGKPWKERSAAEKIKSGAKVCLRLVCLLTLLYFFVCSLDFLSDAFRLLGGAATGEVFKSNAMLANPLANLMMGILATVILQSSSTTTSILVSMVNAQIVGVRPAVFIVMGANIGTSVTNTFVSLGHSMDRQEFRRAFAGATIHDMFNWLTVSLLLPLEWISGSIGGWDGCGLMCQMTAAMTASLETDSNRSYNTNQELLSAITKPFTKLIIQIDKNLITDVAEGKIRAGERSIVKHWCNARGPVPKAVHNATTGDCDIVYVIETYKEKCHFLFENIANHWSDGMVGVCLLILALVMLCACLVGIVKTLHWLLEGHVAHLLRRFLNANLPGCAHHLTGYLAILAGAGMTMLLQSSSVFTSALTPLVGIGVLHLERMYQLTLGSNIGTTFTAILAALASDRNQFRVAFQVALCHLFFNVLGIVVWYPVPKMRAIPISAAQFLGTTTAKYRWFSIVYIVVCFFCLPALVFLLSLAGWYIALAVIGPFAALAVFCLCVNVLQHHKPHLLTPMLRTWNFLPVWLRSLEPYDNLFSSFWLCRKLMNRRKSSVIHPEVVVCHVQAINGEKF